ncbi:lipocalin family protein [Pontibacter saemangeumensis]|uniref:lipocalin family protein n=1 Tax=Pontibacter saemangeumensis TaxID=1084525 RepID=UPI0031EA10D6
MKKINLFALLLVTLFTLSLSSCKDGDEDEEVSPRSAFLTDGEWSGEGIYVVQGANSISVALLLQLAGEQELADQLDAIKDAKFNFEEDGTFTATANGIADSGKWKFTEDEQKIVITDADNDETTFTVKNLTANNLNLELNIEELGMEPVELQGNTINTLELRLVRP